HEALGHVHRRAREVSGLHRPVRGGRARVDPDEGRLGAPGPGEARDAEPLAEQLVEGARYLRGEPIEPAQLPDLDAVATSDGGERVPPPDLVTPDRVRGPRRPCPQQPGHERTDPRTEARGGARE